MAALLESLQIVKLLDGLRFLHVANLSSATPSVLGSSLDTVPLDHSVEFERKLADFIVVCCRIFSVFRALQWGISRLYFDPSYILRGFPCHKRNYTRSSWLNCALRDDEAVYWVSIGHYEAV